MTDNFICSECNLVYKTVGGLRKHQNKYHLNTIKQSTKPAKAYRCSYCNKNFNIRQTRWAHEQKCKLSNEFTIEEKFQKLTNEINELKKQKAITKPQNITNNITNNNTNNIQYVINPIGKESIEHLTIDKQREIMQKGLNSLTYLIESINFNENVPENHSYCVTALNDKHASVINPNTNSIVKTDKNTLFDRIMITNLTKLESMAKNPGFKSSERIEYNNKINALKDQLIMNKKSQKKYYQEVNLISFNNKDLVMDTWASLKNLEQIDLVDVPTDEQKIPDIKAKSKKLIPENYDSSDSELSDSDTDDNEDVLIEITIRGKHYVVNKENIYAKNPDGSPGELYGRYVNGKIIKNKFVEINL